MHSKSSAGQSGGAEGTPSGWKKPKDVKDGAFLSNRYETSEEKEAVIKCMRGEEEAMHADIAAATEAESDSVLAEVMLITIKVAA